MPFAVGLIVIVLVIYYFASRGDDVARDDADAAEEELLHLCLGSRKQAERLLALEQQKAPGIDRGEAVRRAVASLRRDKR